MILYRIKGRCIENQVPVIGTKVLNVTDGTSTTTDNSGVFVFEGLVGNGPRTLIALGDACSTPQNALAHTSIIPIPYTVLTYNITPASPSVTEGQPIRFDITTTDVPDNTVLYWEIVGTGVTANDFTTGDLIGTAVVVNNSGYVTRTVRQDNFVEATETFVMRLRTGSATGPIVATSSSVSIVNQ